MRFNVPFLCGEGVPTDDARTFDRWEWRDLPLTLYAQLENAMGHDEAPIAGSIVEIGRGEGGAITAVIDTDDEGAAGQETARLIQAERLNGISVDYTYADSDLEVECTEEDEDGWCVAVSLHWALASVAAATVVGIPAWSQARIDPTPIGGEESAEGTETEDGEAVVSSGRAVLQLPQRPGQRLQMRPVHAATDGPVVASAADLLAPPAEWFPEAQAAFLPEYTPLTVTDDGQVFGHVAPWGACHIGFSDRCVPPPHSSAGYGHFRTGRREVAAADGTRRQIATGVLTIGTDHAPVRGPLSTPAAAIDHYAHTGCAVADVVAGEDEFGIWIAGALRPGVTEAQLVALRGSAPSGDWRRIGGRHEMVAVLCVNTPGFRQPDGLAASAQVVNVSDDALVIVSPRGALVAGGEVPCGCEDGPTHAEVVARALEPQARAALRERLRPSA